MKKHTEPIGIEDARKYAEALEILSGIVENAGTDRRKLPSFEEICLEAGVDPDDFDRFIYDTFGLSAEEFFTALRTKTPVMML